MSQIKAQIAYYSVVKLTKGMAAMNQSNSRISMSWQRHPVALLSIWALLALLIFSLSACNKLDESFGGSQLSKETQVPETNSSRVESSSAEVSEPASSEESSSIAEAPASVETTEFVFSDVNYKEGNVVPDAAEMILSGFQSKDNKYVVSDGYYKHSSDNNDKEQRNEILNEDEFKAFYTMRIAQFAGCRVWKDDSGRELTVNPTTCDVTIDGKQKIFGSIVDADNNHTKFSLSGAPDSHITLQLLDKVSLIYDEGSGPVTFKKVGEKPIPYILYLDFVPEDAYNDQLFKLMRVLKEKVMNNYPKTNILAYMNTNHQVMALIDISFYQHQ